MRLRERFDEQLEALQVELVRMASLVEVMVADATRVLVEKRVDLIDAVMSAEEQVDMMDLNIESECMLLLATQQPMARDLRIVGSIMKMLADIERIGDYAVDIAKVGRKVAERAPLPTYSDLPRMSELVRTMLHGMVQSFVDRDYEQPKIICQQDEDVDLLYRHVRDATAAAVAGEDESVVAQGIELVLCARYFERMADHVVNIGERIVFIQSGVLLELDP